MLSARARRPKQASNGSAYLPAPMGGLNTIDAGGAMPPADCNLLYNLIAAEQGLRARTGYREWCTNLTGAADNQVRTTLAFKGSQKNGTRDKLFACTSTGIWDVSDSSTAPTLLVTFSVQSGDAGYGIGCVCATPGGRFLLYTDEENGLYVWSESTVTWTRVAVAVNAGWAASTAYAVG